MLSPVGHSSGQLKKNWLSTNHMLISSNMRDTRIPPPCTHKTVWAIVRKTSVQIFSRRKRSGFWRSCLREIMDPNYSAPGLLDPAPFLNFQQRDQTAYFLDSATLPYDHQKFLRGKPYEAHRAKFINPICLRVTGLRVGRKEAPNERLQIAWSLYRN